MYCFIVSVTPNYSPLLRVSEAFSLSTVLLIESCWKKSGLRLNIRLAQAKSYSDADCEIWPLLLVRAINARAASRISSATRASGDTNLGVNQGNNPIRS